MRRKPRLARATPLVVEAAGIAALLAAVTALVSPWIALALAGVVAILTAQLWEKLL